MKHEGDWHIHQTQPGVFIWTSPLGHHYTVTPDDTDMPAPHDGAHIRSGRKPANGPAGHLPEASGTS